MRFLTSVAPPMISPTPSSDSEPRSKSAAVCTGGACTTRCVSTMAMTASAAALHSPETMGLVADVLGHRVVAGAGHAPADVADEERVEVVRRAELAAAREVHEAVVEAEEQRAHDDEPDERLGEVAAQLGGVEVQLVLEEADGVGHGRLPRARSR